MKEVKKCSISGVAFTMDADAYQELENYLDSLKKTYKDTPDGAEIVADIEARMAETHPRRPLGMAQPAAPRVGHRRVGQHQLARRKGAGAALAHPGPHPEEGRLETQRAAVRQAQPAGGVPPFRAECGVRAVIARKFERMTGEYRRERHGGDSRLRLSASECRKAR